MDTGANIQQVCAGVDGQNRGLFVDPAVDSDLKLRINGAGGSDFIKTISLEFPTVVA
jgi:hypothetical protein